MQIRVGLELADHLKQAQNEACEDILMFDLIFALQGHFTKKSKYLMILRVVFCCDNTAVIVIATLYAEAGKHFVNLATSSRPSNQTFRHLF